jgi:trans-2,3-dihydro-3-hydroxyanthranilate isomerase
VSAPAERLARFDPFSRTGPDGGLHYVLLDVFAERPLQGNQLAVFPAPGALDTAAMQALALELRLSESVFLFPAEGGGDVRVRIFTPASELPFAGHPVLGTGALLAVALERSSVVLETGAGPVGVELESADGAGMSAAMAQPIPSWEPVEEPERLFAALGLESSALPVERYRNGPEHILVAADSPARVAALEPDLQALEAAAGPAGVSCFAGGEGRFKTRMFAPGVGIPEDPATGSAAGPLAVHLVRHGLAGRGERLEVRQGAEMGRPSLLLACADGHGEDFERVEVGGSVVAVGRGELYPG